MRVAVTERSSWFLYRVDGGDQHCWKYLTYTFRVAIGFVDGHDYNIKVRASDSSGNQGIGPGGDQSKTFTWIDQSRHLLDKITVEDSNLVNDAAYNSILSLAGTAQTFSGLVQSVDM